jgi:hypothetical protein
MQAFVEAFFRLASFACICGKEEKTKSIGGESFFACKTPS